MPLDSSSLGSTQRNLHQQKIFEHLMKERLHKLKRYIARWMYVQGEWIIFGWVLLYLIDVFAEF
jgi:hypothetical protein